MAFIGHATKFLQAFWVYSLSSLLDPPHLELNYPVIEPWLLSWHPGEEVRHL